MSGDLSMFDEMAVFDVAPTLDGKAGMGRYRMTEAERRAKIAALRSEWGVELGQIWQINRPDGPVHTALCADSRNPDSYWPISKRHGRVVGVFTSPPYLNQRDYASIEQGLSTDWDGMMFDVFQALSEFVAPDCQILVNLGLIFRQYKVLQYWHRWVTSYMEDEFEWPLIGWYTWDKLIPFPGRYYGKLATRHEWVFHFAQLLREPVKFVPTKNAGKYGKGSAKQAGKQGQTYGHGKWTVASGIIADYKIAESVVKMVGQETIDLITEMLADALEAQDPMSVVELAVPGGFREKDKGAKTAQLHPARYPVELPMHYMQAYNVGPDAGAWLDPFAGSFTNVLSGDRLGLPTVVMENDPGLFAVGLQRCADEEFAVKFIGTY